MKFVSSLAFNSTTQYCELAHALDQAGFDAVAVSDHVVHPEKIRTPYPYTKDGNPRWEAFTDWPDPWVAIGAMAAVTERIRFITSVFVLPMRNPFLVAKAVSTAAVLSGGRVAMGVGAGWMQDEFELMQQDFRTRGRRLNEMLGVLRELWSGGMVEHHGEFYEFDRLEMSPVPPGPVPIYVGGLSEPALRRAARFGDGWISDLHSTDEIGNYVSKLRQYRAEAGQHAEFHVLVSASDAFDLDGYRRLEDVGVTHILTMPWLFYGGATDSLDAKRNGIHRFAEDIIQKR